jgi:peroxin-19
MTKDLFGGAAGGEAGADGAGMDKIMAEFSKFLKESEGNEDMKSALDSVVNELLTKDTLYEPMKTLREEYPVWLEANWEKVSNAQVENYNNQLDKINEICDFYESPEGEKPEN